MAQNLVESWVNEMEADLKVQEEEWEEGEEPYDSYDDGWAYAASMCNPEQIWELWNQAGCESVEGLDLDDQDIFDIIEPIALKAWQAMNEHYCYDNMVEPVWD